MSTSSSLLSGYEDAPPLSTEMYQGRYLVNPTSTKLSSSYETFPNPIQPRSAGNAFDFHGGLVIVSPLTAVNILLKVYWATNSGVQVEYAKQLYERIRREFPEVCGED